MCSMNIVSKSYEFAVNAFDGKYRKAELDKPTVIHSIDVAHKLNSYGFDKNVVAAGYLHDIVEDTDYTEEDLLKLFGDDITSLVMGATEKDKSLSWEDRKLGTINRVKNLDIRHKAIVTCDKISNIEDLRFKFGKNGYVDYSSFNRGKDKKIWYWKEVYKSLIYGEDKNLPMFVKLKRNIDDIDNISKLLKSGYYPDMDVIDASLDTTSKARELHYKKSELYKILSILGNSDSFVVEFTGDNSIEKSKMINKLKTYFILSGFNVLTIDDVNLFNKNKYYYNKENDIILIDRAFLDRIIYMDILNKNGKINYKKYRNHIFSNKKNIDDNIDMVVVLKRFNNIIYNKSLNMCIDKYMDDKTSIYINNKRDLCNDDLVEIADKILINMRSKYIKEANNKYLVKTRVVNN